jgi:isoleucyl-tRNA synthetase
MGCFQPNVKGYAFDNAFRRHRQVIILYADAAGFARWVFYEGSPTANGRPHPGHVLTRVVKDLFPRYKTMCGYFVPRKAGWDTHGLPVEMNRARASILNFRDSKFAVMEIEY